MTREHRIVHPLVHRIVKFLPNDPPERGDVVLVDGERCRVARDPKLKWDGLDWRLVGPIVVKSAPTSDREGT